MKMKNVFNWKLREFEILIIFLPMNPFPPNARIFLTGLLAGSGSAELMSEMARERVRRIINGFIFKEF